VAFPRRGVEPWHCCWVQGSWSWGCNALKIDRGFINPTAEGAINQAIVRSTIALGHTLGLEVIAEGIETERQLDELTPEALGLPAAGTPRPAGLAFVKMISSA
jgi:hypothetical protein